MNVGFEDYAAIRALTARYNAAADKGDLDGFVDCFISGGVFDIQGFGVLDDADKMRALIASLTFPTLHTTTDPVIEVDGDTATQDCSLVILARRADQTDMQVLTSGRYRDELERTGQGWRFARRTAYPDNDLMAAVMAFNPQMANGSN